MEISPKKRLLIELATLLLIITISLSIYIHGKTISCSGCQLDFKNINENAKISINATDLYHGFVNKTCRIIWSKANGYGFE